MASTPTRLAGSSFRYLPPGRYLVRGIIDANNNRVLDRRELFDTATVSLTDSASHEMLAFVHDSVGAGLDRGRSSRLGDASKPFRSSAATWRASLRVAVLSAGRRLVRRPDRVGHARKRVREAAGRQRKGQGSGGLHCARAAGRLDRTREPTSRASAIPDPRRPHAAPGAAARDTTPRPKMSAPVPETYAILKLGRALTPATTYRLRADSLRSLMGIARTSDRVFIAPRHTTDSTRARGDSARRPDSTRRPPPPPARRPPQRDNLSLGLVRELFTPGVRK